MRLSFDLDDTLFVSPENFKTENALPFPLSVIYRERLRLGTRELFAQLRAMGVETWIYTTSFRSERYIRGLLRCYGIRVAQVVNGQRHQQEVQGNRREPMPSKYPGRYRIDLHIDDDVSVAHNGRAYGFRVHLVGAQDDEWAQKILREAEKIISRKENAHG